MLRQWGLNNILSKFLVLLLLLPPVHAESIAPKAEAVETPVSAASSAPIKVIDITALIKDDANKYKVSYQKLYDTLSCESGGFTDVAIQSGYIKNGKQENSWGIAQVDLDYHPDISKEEAIDPAFAIDYAAKQFAAGNASEWSCYIFGEKEGWK